MDEPVQIPIDGVLDLHTFKPRELKDLVPDYLAACRERGIYEVRIIHGKGIGNLRRTVHALLARNPAVASFTLDHPHRRLGRDDRSFAQARASSIRICGGRSCMTVRGVLGRRRVQGCSKVGLTQSKAEARIPKAERRPKPELPNPQLSPRSGSPSGQVVLGFRVSAFFRPSGFEFRISRV